MDAISQPVWLPMQLPHSTSSDRPTECHPDPAPGPPSIIPRVFVNRPENVSREAAAGAPQANTPWETFKPDDQYVNDVHPGPAHVDIAVRLKDVTTNTAEM